MRNNRQRLTTFLGGVIDSLNYFDISLIIAFNILVSAVYYWISNPYGNGTNQTGLSIPDALYFSVTTVTTLGYGDISPCGWGKFVSSIQVISGLTLTAIFVGKIASERQSAMLRLVYTSENQKRIVEMEKQIIVLEEMIEPILEEHNHPALFKKTKEIYRFITSISNYLHFHANHGDLASAGNNSSLRRLYKAISKLQVIIYSAIRTYGVEDRTRTKLEQISVRINAIATTMTPFHQNDVKIVTTLADITRFQTIILAWINKAVKEINDYKYRIEISNYLLERVLEKIPAAPWPRNFHRAIATELGVQNRLVQKCIQKLIADNRI